MPPTTTSVPVAAFACPGCDCRMCVSDAAKAIESLDGVVHVRVDRRKRAFVVRHEPTLGMSAIESCIVDAGLDPL